MKVIDFLKEYIYENSIKDKYYLDSLNKLIMFYYNIDLSKLAFKLKDEIDTKEKEYLRGLFEKLVKEDIPLEYITSVKKLYNETYFVNNNVLIPRDDTEILIYEAIKLIEKYSLESLLDICTGSGCIGISICNNSSIKEAYLCDISEKALDVANKNIKLNKCSKNIKTIKSDLFSNINDDKKFDIITANPPYITKEDMEKLDESVKKEPYNALYGGEDGLYFYIKIINESIHYLKNDGFLVLEIGYNQKEDLMQIIFNAKNMEYIDCIKDFAGNDRVIVCRFHQI